MTTVDVLSNGRAQLGVGAGWYKEESLAYRIEWKSFKERIDRMLEALNIILKLWTEETPINKGKYYSISKTPFGFLHRWKKGCDEVWTIISLKKPK